MDRLLLRLKGAKAPLSGTTLAQGLGVTRAAIHKRIQKLRDAGHRIGGTNRVGYQWAGSSNRFDPQTLKRGMVTNVIHFPVVGSTQDEAKSRASQGAPEGTLLIADRQTSGRGRLGRSWISPKGGLWFSLILRPRVRPDHVPGLTLVAALDWVETLRVRGVQAEVKWPNDVWADGKKIAGILTEMSAETDRVHWVALGVGVNVNNRAPVSTAVPATAVSAWTGTIALGDLMEDWLERFTKSYARFCQSGFAPFRSAYEKRSLLSGALITFEGPQGKSSGRVKTIDAFGRLRISTAQGDVVCLGGEVSLLRPVEPKTVKRGNA